MASLLTQRQRVPGVTSGVALNVNLGAAIDGLRNEPAWASGRNAKTLAKYSDFRVVLTVLKRGVTVREHHAAGRISVQTLAGHICMHVEGRTFDLPPGGLLMLDRAVAHDVEALEESAFLLTIAWPEH